MIYITINAQNNVTEAIDSDRQAIPGGAIQLTPVEAQLIATHPVGHAAFDYINNALVENTTRRDARTLDRNRRREIREIKAHAFGLIGALVPALANENTLDLIVALLKDGAFASGFPTAGSDMERVKDIYIYAKGKISQARTATQAQLDAYDPATDTNWP